MSIVVIGSLVYFGEGGLGGNGEDVDVFSARMLAR